MLLNFVQEGILYKTQPFYRQSRLSTMQQQVADRRAQETSEQKYTTTVSFLVYTSNNIVRVGRQFLVVSSSLPYFRIRKEEETTRKQLSHTINLYSTKVNHTTIQGKALCNYVFKTLQIVRSKINCIYTVYNLSDIQICSCQLVL